MVNTRPNDSEKPQETAANEATEGEHEAAADELASHIVETEAGEVTDRGAALEAEAADLKDQLLRALAETENLRRRSQREREDAVRYAAAPLIKDLIEVADNLRRALEAVPAEAVEGDEHLKTLMTGVEMTEKAMQGVLEKHNIQRIDPVGERLDPHWHEAIFEVPEPNKPAGTVVQVVRVGYRLHDRLLRAAQVGVAKGGPSAAANGAKGETGDGERREPGSRVDTTA